MIELNKVFISGRLTQRPSLTTSANSQQPMCICTVSVTRTWKNRDGVQCETNHVDCISFGDIAQAFCHACEGQMVLIEGKLSQDRVVRSEPSGQAKRDVKDRLAVLVTSFQPIEPNARN